MVHALHEAQRVLQPGGLLIDLRPAPVHRHIGISNDGVYRELGVMRENLSDDRAANRAVQHVVAEGLFKPGWRSKIPCDRVIDTYREFQVWLAEFVELGRMPSHDRLAKRVENALATARGKKKVVIRAPLMLKVLKKPG